MKQVNEDSADDELVWGAAEIAKIINRNERQTYHLFAGGHLDGAVKQIGRLLVGRRSKLRELV
jgi:hypothetical protein